MKYSINDFEIMAPVGSRDSLQAAIQAGANSVYFGVGQLNMRSHSANPFTIDDLREIAATCNEHGIKSYLTVNTIIYDGDMEQMHAIVDAAKEAGISAIIAMDISVLTYAREHSAEHQQCGGVEILRPVRRCGGAGKRTGPRPGG